MDRIDLDKIPSNLIEEVKKYLKDPKRYVKLYPVSYKMIKPYLKLKG